MLPEARERALLLTDVHTEVHLDLTSTDAFTVEGPDVVTVVNDGEIDTAALRFVEAVRAPALPPGESSNRNAPDAET